MPFLSKAWVSCSMRKVLPTPALMPIYILNLPLLDLRMSVRNSSASLSVAGLLFASSITKILPGLIYYSLNQIISFQVCQGRYSISAHLLFQDPVCRATVFQHAG